MRVYQRNRLFAFIPTAYRGVAELGMIAGVGMFISLFVSIVLAPALLHVLPRPGSAKRAALLPDRLAAFPRQHARGVLAAAGVVWVIAALSLPFAKFDTEPVNLNNQRAQSVIAYHELAIDPDHSPHSISAIFDRADGATAAVNDLQRLSTVKSVRSISDFLPADQDEKSFLIEDLALVMGEDLAPTQRTTPDPNAIKNAFDELRATLRNSNDKQTPVEFRNALAKLSKSLARFAAHAESLPAAERLNLFSALDRKLLDSLDGRLMALNHSLSGGEFTEQDLPRDLRRRWLTDDGRYRVEVFPSQIITDRYSAKQFVRDVEKVVGDRATGAPIINLGAADAVTKAFIQAFVSAFIIIFCLLWLILRSVKEVTVVLTPLMLAGLITAAFSVFLKIPFNFANIIALPLLLGIGVDSAVHILHRYKTALPENRNLLQTSTARAVLFSALTTVVSFGNLAVSTHAGTASMGVMLSIGVVSTLVCTLVVLPALLKQYIAIPSQ